jgi:UDP-3-O-[3-hydroxymyristoyl] glucosamine N-acyltransferase
VLTRHPIDESVIILPGSVIMPGVKIGKCSIINTAACIDHDTKIGKGCHVMGNAYVAGRVNIGNYSTIGSNSTIFPDINIGSNCFIGAGSVVNKNVEDNQIVVGNPARFLKDNRPLPAIVPF